MIFSNFRTKYLFAILLLQTKFTYSNNIDSLLNSADKFSRSRLGDSSISIYNFLISQKIYTYQRQAVILNYLKDIKASKYNTVRGDQLVLNLIESLISTGYPFTDFINSLDFDFYLRNKLKLDVLKLKQDSIFVNKINFLKNKLVCYNLKKMFDEDQRVRFEYNLYETKNDTLKLKEIDKEWNYIDIVNRNLLKSILDEYGVPDENDIGGFGQMYLKLLFLHQDDSTFLYAYLNVLYKANKSGKIQNIEHIIDKSMYLLTSKTIYGKWIGGEPRVKDAEEIRKRLKAVNIDY